MLVIVSPALLFFLWMLSLSLKPEVDNISYPPVLIPTTLAWSNYAQVFAENSFGRYFINSLIVTGSATLIGLVIGAPAAYGIARAKATKLSVVVMIARMTPGLSYLIPLFLMFRWLGLMGTLWPQIITHLVITLPIVIWVMIGYFEALPIELEEAGRIDGANRWQVFRHVVLPLTRPGLTRGAAAVLHLLLEQLRLRHRAGRAHHPHPAGRGLQLADLRAGQLGPALGRGAGGGAAGAGADHRRPEADRGRPDLRRGEGRLSRRPFMNSSMHPNWITCKLGKMP